MIRSAKTGPDGEILYISSLSLSTDKTGELILLEQKEERLRRQWHG